MHSITSWFTKNPVAANLLMFFLIVAGYFTLNSIRIEGFPALPPDSVSITTFYPGASAKQVDRNISRRIELAVKGTPGLKRISSISAENFSIISLKKNSGFDIDRFQNEIKTKVDSIPNLPQLADRPVISRDEFKVEALIVQIYGDVDITTLQKAARQVREDLLSDPLITKIELFGLKTHEIRIETDKTKLEALGLSFEDIAASIQASSLDYRKGNLRNENGRITIKADKKTLNYKDFLNIPIISSKSGKRIVLADVATIIDGFAEESGFARFQGKPSVGIQIYTSQKGSLLEVSEAVNLRIKKLKNSLPKSISLDVWGEYSKYMKKRLNLLQINAVQGLIIVFILLALFLNIKLAFWVAAGIPISMAGALALMGKSFFDYSLNDITTFGFIIVLGILVDDAIVVGESVFEERSKTKDPIKGTIKGVNKVATATIFGCLTTVAAFYPLLLIDNDLGKIFAGFSVVVIISILFSLLESKLILPSHLASISLEKTPSSNIFSKTISKVQNKADQFLNFLNKNIYLPILKQALKNKIASLIVIGSFAFIIFSMIFTGQIRTVFFPEIPGNIINVSLKMNSGTPVKTTIRNLEIIESAAEKLNQEYKKNHPAALPPIAKIMTAFIPPYQGEIYAELNDPEKSNITSEEILNIWRANVGKPEGTEQLSFSGSFETGGGFAIELSAENEEILKSSSVAFIDQLKKIDGVIEIYEDLRKGSPQIKLKLKPEAEHLGLRTSHLAGQIGDSFGGLKIQRLLRNKEEIRVYMKLKRENRQYISDLLNTKIRTPEGRHIPLSLVADIEYSIEPGSINRRNGRRTSLVQAKLIKNKISSSEVLKIISSTIEPTLKSRFPSLEIKAAGELEEMTEMRKGMKKAMIIIVLLIYTLLAIPLKSYFQPFIIMSVVPFGIVGALVGHILTGFPLSILSFFGMMAVTGVVVNDSLVMITRFNDLYRGGMPLAEAVITAGTSRFRAVFLTTITTSAGLMPLLLETSEQAQYLKPAALSLAFGEIIATPITLILIPLLITIFANIKELLFKLKTRQEKIGLE